jgi:hydroxyacylglutathione hydrolase
MTIERFEVPGLAQYSYMIEDAGEALVIDPMRDIMRYLGTAAANGCKITHVLETHIHADYASGAKALAERTGAELAISAHDASERFQYTMPHRGLHDGNVVQVGSLRLKALYTPGHTPEHLSFLLHEQGCSEPSTMFSGDFLFVGALGRPDLLGEAETARLGAEMYRSVSERIAGLPDALKVYPGHGAGSLCGAGMSDRPESTLGEERATNPYFGYGEQEFVHAILEASPDMPSYYPRMKELNSMGVVAYESLPEMKGLSAEEVAAADATVIDLRKPEAFGEAHVPEALNLGIAGNLSMWAGWLLEPETDVIFVGETEEDCREARTALARVGLDRVRGYLRGGTAAWIAEGRRTSQTKQATSAEVEHASGSRGMAVILDVRNAGERAAGGIAGAHGIPLGELPAALKDLSREREIVAVCGSGYRSSAAASLLQRAGFERVSHLGGGMAAWQCRDQGRSG